MANKEKQIVPEGSEGVRYIYDPTTEVWHIAEQDRPFAEEGLVPAVRGTPEGPGPGPTRQDMTVSWRIILTTLRTFTPEETHVPPLPSLRKFPTSE